MDRLVSHISLSSILASASLDVAVGFGEARAALWAPRPVLLYRTGRGAF